MKVSILDRRAVSRGEMSPRSVVFVWWEAGSMEVLCIYHYAGLPINLGASQHQGDGQWMCERAYGHILRIPGPKTLFQASPFVWVVKPEI